MDNIREDIAAAYVVEAGHEIGAAVGVYGRGLNETMIFSEAMAMEVGEEKAGEETEGQKMVLPPEFIPNKTASTWFKPGNPGGPGRPKKSEQETATLLAIKAAFTPAELTDYLRDALAIAKAQQSARGMIAVLEFVANYVIGKPIQRIETQSSGLMEVIAMLQGE